MNNRVAVLLEGARSEVAAARSLSRDGFERQSVSRAHYAAFYAAEAALRTLGEERKRHSGVVSAFGRLVIKDGGLDPAVGGVLQRLFEARNVADYGWFDAPEREGDDAADDAERFVTAVEAWIQERAES